MNFKDEDAYLDVNDENRKFAGRAFTQALIKNMDDNFCQEGEDNKNKLPYELRTNWRAFQNRCVKDLNKSILFRCSNVKSWCEWSNWTYTQKMKLRKIRKNSKEPIER